MMLRIGGRPDHGFDEPLGLLSDCHRRIEHFLEILMTVDRQASGGPLTAAQRQDLDAALRYFATAAPTHTADEEESLFPRLRATDVAGHTIPVLARLEQDHDAADRRHRAVDYLGRRWLDVDHLDSAEAAAFQEHVTALHTMYREHIRIEDRELFPAAFALLRPTDLAEVGREMAARRGRTVGS
jgi:hemerythrin-like domain-containing protein